MLSFRAFLFKNIQFQPIVKAILLQIYEKFCTILELEAF